MLRYKKGDIVICVTNKMYGMTYLLEEGEQYRIDDCIEMSEKNLVSVTPFSIFCARQLVGQANNTLCPSFPYPYMRKTYHTLHILP
jgi:hypothetical protein